MGAVTRLRRVASLQVGQELVLKREPHNPYDSNAIAVCDTAGNSLGYIRRELAQELAEKMDGDLKLCVAVTSLTGGDAGMNYGVNIHVTSQSAKRDADTQNDVLYDIWDFE